MGKDTIYRQDAIEALGEEPEVWSGRDEYEQGLNNQWHYDVNALKALPSAQPERKKGKLISLDDFRRKYNTCGYKCSECGEHSEYEETSAQTAEVITEVNRMSKDVVYRQAAIEALHEWENLCEWDSWINEHQEQTGSVSPSNVIEQLPSAQPERKTGKWIQEIKHYKDDEQEYYHYEEHCSNCGVKREIGWGYASFCPNCGADMRGEQDE